MKIHQWFLPSRKNKFHPPVLRTAGLLAFLVIFIAIPPIYNMVSVGNPQVLGYATNINVTDLFNASNQERINNGLAPLNLDSALNNAAQAKAADMFADNYWAHVAPDGTTPWYFITNAGYSYSMAGENLAKDFSTSSGVVTGWMGSTLHRANILNTSYKDVGYAAVNGTLLGAETTLVVAMYGLRESPTVAATSPEPEPSTPENIPSTTEQSNYISEVNDVDTNSGDDSNSPAMASNAEPNDVSDAKQVTGDTNTSTINNQDGKQAVGNPIKVANDPLANFGMVAGAMVTLPVKAYNSFNWGQKASILLVCTLMLLFIMKHTLIWREKKRGFKHIWLRAHPLGQMFVLAAVFIVTLASGVGVVL